MCQKVDRAGASAKSCDSYTALLRRLHFAGRAERDPAERVGRSP
jgi:hypothetical protein